MTGSLRSSVPVLWPVDLTEDPLQGQSSTLGGRMQRRDSCSPRKSFSGKFVSTRGVTVPKCVHDHLHVFDLNKGLLRSEDSMHT